MTNEDIGGPEQYGRETELLREARPTLTSSELDHLYRRVQARAVKPRRVFIRSRAAVAAVIASGMVLTGGSTAVALSGLGQSGSASIAQYGTPGTGPGGRLGPAPKSLGTAPSGEEQQITQLQAPEQVSTPSSQLPFTGYALFPVMLVGLCLIGIGLLAHRRLRPEGRSS